MAGDGCAHAADQDAFQGAMPLVADHDQAIVAFFGCLDDYVSWITLFDYYFVLMFWLVGKSSSALRT